MLFIKRLGMSTSTNIFAQKTSASRLLNKFCNTWMTSKVQVLELKPSKTMSALLSTSNKLKAQKI